MKKKAKKKKKTLVCSLVTDHEPYAPCAAERCADCNAWIWVSRRQLNRVDEWVCVECRLRRSEPLQATEKIILMLYREMLAQRVKKFQEGRGTN
jgi:hypothetical protein